MNTIIEKLIDLMPLWAIITIAVMFVAMKFYYTRFKVLEDRTKHADCRNKNAKVDELASYVKQAKEDFVAIKTDNHNKNTKIDELSFYVKQVKEDLAAIKTDSRNKNAKIDELSTGIKQAMEDLVAIKAILTQKFPSAANIFSLKRSPRRLNDLGEQVFRQIHGREFLEENKDFFFSKIDGMRPKTELDVENAANFACSGFTDDDRFNRLKDFVYNAPSITIKGDNGEGRPYDITLGDICYILSLPLRDMYLAERFKKG